jgi:hypothetical protein
MNGGRNAEDLILAHTVAVDPSIWELEDVVCLIEPVSLGRLFKHR